MPAHDAARTAITVLARANWSAPSVVVEGYLLAGSLDEPLDASPASPPSRWACWAAARGGAPSPRSTRRSRRSARRSATASTTATSSAFSTKSLAEDLDLVLDVLVDELRNPIFPAEHVEKIRGLRMTAIAERENDTRQMAGQRLPRADVRRRTRSAVTCWAIGRRWRRLTGTPGWCASTRRTSGRRAWSWRSWRAPAEEAVQKIAAVRDLTGRLRAPWLRGARAQARVNAAPAGGDARQIAVGPHIGLALDAAQFG